MAGSFPVWLVRFNLGMQDPDMVGTRYHTVLFVETDSVSGAGVLHHVTGDITSKGGMRYESRNEGRPDDREDYSSKVLLGYTDELDHKDKWDVTLCALRTPPQQKAYNMATNRTEPVKIWEPLTFYEPGESRRPLIKCTEWIETSAIPELRSCGMLHPVKLSRVSDKLGATVLKLDLQQQFGFSNNQDLS